MGQLYHGDPAGGALFHGNFGVPFVRKNPDGDLIGSSQALTQQSLAMPSLAELVGRHGIDAMPPTTTVSTAAATTTSYSSNRSVSFPPGSRANGEAEKALQSADYLLQLCDDARFRTPLSGRSSAATDGGDAAVAMPSKAASDIAASADERQLGSVGSEEAVSSSERLLFSGGVSATRLPQPPAAARDMEVFNIDDDSE